MATLKFGAASSIDGFTQHSTAAFNDLPPARIVRELLQNSLDAAAEAGKATAQVRFQVESIRLQDLPDAKGYENAFRKAVKYHKNNGDLSDAAQEVVDRIEVALSALNGEEAVMLSVVDNGVGLNSDRMNRLLADGSSGKSATASGSYGVGHLAPMALSNLRYTLYGGLTEDGSRVACGKAILAAHPGKKNLNDAKGYLIEGFSDGLDGNLYDFLPLQSHPELLAKHLDAIRKEWGHGCVVLMPAFNHFGSRGISLWEIVSKVAAYNFAPAIHRKKLVITVQEGGDEKEPQRLDERTLTGVLEPEQDRVRVARSDSLFAGLRPSGQNAYQILRALTDGNPAPVTIKQDKARISLLTPSPNGSSRIDLFRNGMWITDSIPRLRMADFADRQPFHAVIEIDAEDGGELRRLIRKAEGPMHDKLSLSLLSRPQQKELKKKFSEIADWINGQVPPVVNDTYTVDDFLVINSGDAGPQGQNSFSFWGVPTVASRRSVAQVILEPEGNSDAETTRDDRIKDPGPPRPYPPSPPKPRPSRPLSFRSAVVPDGSGKLVGSVTSLSNFAEAWVAFKVDENTDHTCDRVWSDEAVTVKSFLIRPLASNVAQPASEIINKGRFVKIRGIVASANYEVRVEYAVPAGLAGIVENPVLRMELHRPPNPNPKQRGEVV